jgi:uncharacterized RDD family membrane protein YckC
MVTDFNDVINMQNLWGRRFAALIIDIIILTLLMWILSAILYPLISAAGIFNFLNYWIILAALIIIVYFTYMEGKSGSTLGKRMLKLRVKALEGNLDYKKSFIRNLSKILWVPIILDLILGFALGDSNDRFLDKVSRTFVVMDTTEPPKTENFANEKPTE